MTPETRRAAWQAYLVALDKPLRQPVRLQAQVVVALVRALFAAEQEIAVLRREERLDAAEQHLEQKLARAEARVAGRRRNHSRQPTSRVKPAACHPGVQRNFQFATAAIPPPSTFDIPPTGECR